MSRNDVAVRTAEAVSRGGQCNTTMLTSHVEIPRLCTLSRHAGRHLVEATLMPLALFYGAITLCGQATALLVALGWCYLAVARRLLTRRRVPGLLALAALGLTARTVMALSTGSLFLYFLQPTLSNGLIGAIFLASVAGRTSMAERLAADFCPLPQDFLSHPAVHRFFNRVTLLWAGVQLANAAITIVLLVSQPVTTFLWTRSVVSAMVTAMAIAVSVVWFKRSMRRHGVIVAYAG
jgi:hypothetical protein